MVLHLCLPWRLTLFPVVEMRGRGSAAGGECDHTLTVDSVPLHQWEKLSLDSLQPPPWEPEGFSGEKPWMRETIFLSFPTGSHSSTNPHTTLGTSFNLSSLIFQRGYRGCRVALLLVSPYRCPSLFIYLISCLSGDLKSRMCLWKSCAWSLCSIKLEVFLVLSM